MIFPHRHTSNGTSIHLCDGGFVTTDFSGATDDIAYAMTMTGRWQTDLAGRTGDYPEFYFAVAATERWPAGSTPLGRRQEASDFSSSDHAYAVALPANARCPRRHCYR